MFKMKQVNNFPLQTLVTWRTQDQSSWIIRLTERFGPGPFTVLDVESGIYEVPKVMLADRKQDKILKHSDNQQRFFNKSWLTEWPG